MIWLIRPPTFHSKGSAKAGAKRDARPPRMTPRAGRDFPLKRTVSILCVLFRRTTIRATVLFELFRPPPNARGWSRPRQLGGQNGDFRFAVCNRSGFENGVARKWRRNGLKRLNPRPEMVWARKPRTYKIWYIGARLRPAQEPRERQSCRKRRPTF